MIEDFNLIKPLGKGSHGKVFLAEKIDTKQHVALKVMKKEESEADPEIFQLDHPFLLELYYYFENPTKKFFVMKLMRGGEIFQHLRKDRRFIESRAKFYAAQICLALEYLHENDIVYRDVKPENILMDEDGYVCLADFERAIKIDKLEETTVFVGSPEYIAPEILIYQKYFKETDWWAFGILIYEMIVGIPPFYHHNQDMMLDLILNSELRFPTQIVLSSESKDLITRLLDKDIKKRMGTNGCNEIKQHPWFSEIDWEALLQKKVLAPFKPVIRGELYEFDETQFQILFKAWNFIDF